MSEPCPVCGWSVIREEHIPANPDPEHGPDSPGTFYVHRLESIGNGRFELRGCSLYEDGERDPFDVEEGDR